MIWVSAYRSNALMHFLSPQAGHWEPRSHLYLYGYPRDYNRYDMSQRDRMEQLWGQYQLAFPWSVPGCRKYYTCFTHANHGLSCVCTESRAVVQNFSQDWIRLDINPFQDIYPFRIPNWRQMLRPIDPFHDIFTFRTLRWRHEISLITTRPKVTPTRMAIEVLEGHDPNFSFLGPDPTSWYKANNPALDAALDWGRDAKEEEATGVRAMVRPSQDTVAIDLKNLRTIYILSYGIEPRNKSVSADGRAQISPQHYVEMVHGLESSFYILDTGDEATQAAWTIPGYVALCQVGMQRRVQGSEVWKVNVEVMAAIHKGTLRDRGAINALEPAEEIWFVARAMGASP